MIFLSCDDIMLEGTIKRRKAWELARRCCFRGLDNARTSIRGGLSWESLLLTTRIDGKWEANFVKNFSIRIAMISIILMFNLS